MAEATILDISSPTIVKIISGEGEIFEYVSPSISLFIPENRKRIEVACNSRKIKLLLGVLKNRLLGEAAILSTPPYEDVISLSVIESKLIHFLGVNEDNQ